MKRNVEKRGGRAESRKWYIHSSMSTRKRRARRMYSSDLNTSTLIFGMVAQQNFVGTRQLHDRTESNLSFFFARGSSLFALYNERSSCQAMMPNTSRSRKHSFRINSIADYRYRFSSHAFPSPYNAGLIQFACNREHPLHPDYNADSKIEYYSSIASSAVKEHDGDSIFLHIIVFRSLDNGLPRARV